MKSDRCLSSELEGFHPRQRELLRVILTSGGATVREIHAQIPEAPPSICGIRTLLNRLVHKGVLRSRRSGRHSEVIYLPTATDSFVQMRAFDRITHAHFGGSKSKAFQLLERLAANDVGRVGDVTQKSR